MELYKDVADKLKTHMGGMTVTEAARRLGMEPAALSRFLSGRHGMTLATIHKIATVLQRDVDVQFPPKRTDTPKK